MSHIQLPDEDGSIDDANECVYWIGTRSYWFYGIGDITGRTDDEPLEARDFRSTISAWSHEPLWWRPGEPDAHYGYYQQWNCFCEHGMQFAFAYYDRSNQYCFLSARVDVVHGIIHWFGEMKKPHEEPNWSAWVTTIIFLQAPYQNDITKIGMLHVMLFNDLELL
ncbi:hypothetical protein FOMPIDRAFT_1020424 [Fomitopsis schrenkii]|uniref:Uncharacterized protein n=1 Tax=Fomitopsis schrenkii TaxID=2126942 RepID=S8F473_FOMSC|nr:hypothetical protein FOMPIDRAFT_1020424 [Fomitopsis schrenkii]